MSEQNEVALAHFTYKLSATTGYDCEGSVHDVTPEHWGRISAAIDGNHAPAAQSEPPVMPNAIRALENIAAGSIPIHLTVREYAMHALADGNYPTAAQVPDALKDEVVGMALSAYKRELERTRDKAGSRQDREFVQSLLDRLDIATAMLAAAPKPAAQEHNGGKFFAYDDNVGFELYDTAGEAKKSAQESLVELRAEADVGWDEAVEIICWGVVLGTTREIELPQEGYDGRNGVAGMDRYVDYVLHDVAPKPEGGAA
jgi:hypothetical protein